MTSGGQSVELDLTIMVAAYNEERKLWSAVEKIVSSARQASLRFEVVIVNDGSVDRTQDVCRNLVAHFGSDIILVIQNDHNIGMGASFRKALSIARGQSLAWFPGDDDIPADSMAMLFAQKDVAQLATLFLLNREERGWMRNVISSLYIFVHMVVFDVYLLYLTGPGIYPVKLLKTLDLKAERFGFAAEIHVKLWRKGVSVIELPTYAKTGVVDSSAIKPHNIWEAIRTFTRLIWEVHFSKRAAYRLRAHHVQIGFATLQPK